MKRRYPAVWAAAFWMLTACAAVPDVTQEAQISAETSSAETTQADVPPESEPPDAIPEVSAAEVPDSEYVFGTVGEQAALLPYDEFEQERLMFEAFDADYAEDNVLRRGFALGSAEQLERCKLLFSETAARIGSAAAEEEALQAAALLDAFAVYAAAYPSEEYIFLVFCGGNPQDKSQYSSYLGTDIAFDGANIELVPRYEVTDEEAALHEQTPALSPPQYLWVGAVPRTFLSADAEQLTE